MSVVLCAPAAVAALASHHPDRHAAVAAALGCSGFGSSQTTLSATLKSKLVQLMRSTGMPSGTHVFLVKSLFLSLFRAPSLLCALDVTYVVSGIAAAGYSSSDAASLAAATMAQQRLLNNMPTCYEQHSIQRVFEEAMSYW
jgi:hypothetical protein